jgi:hypothetical protein
MAGRYDNPIPTRFLVPMECLKIPALKPLESLCFFFINEKSQQSVTLPHLKPLFPINKYNFVAF